MIGIVSMFYLFQRIDQYQNVKTLKIEVQKLGKSFVLKNTLINCYNKTIYLASRLRPKIVINDTKDIFIYKINNLKSNIHAT